MAHGTLAPEPNLLDVWEMPTGAAIALWLAAGYCYEVERFELIPDTIWHALCDRLAQTLPGYVHPLGHHALIEADALTTGTCSYLQPKDFPPLARGLAERLSREWKKGEAPYRLSVELNSGAEVF